MNRVKINKWHVNNAIFTVTSSVKDIKKDLSKLEKSMEGKIGSMQTRMMEAEKKLRRR